MDGTRIAFLSTRLLSTPLFALYAMLPFILYRDLGATPFQIGVAIAAKPAASILSIYWSGAIHSRRDRLLSNLIWASVFGLLPFFFFPLFSNPWLLIASSAFFMLFHRGAIPAWMEIMKLTVPPVARERLFALGATVSYVGDALFCFLGGWVLDRYLDAWCWLFPLTAALSLAALFFQRCIAIPPQTEGAVKESPSLGAFLLRPWRESWRLLVRRLDFGYFQMGFMLGGGGLMIIQAVLPRYFMGTLDLSYTELALALTLCKGIGFAATSQLWARLLPSVDIYRFCSAVTALAFLFPVALFAAQGTLFWLYAAYLLYGTMQAGSTLGWNMSGPLFAGHEDSSLYSGVNVMTVGVRGLIAPLFGAIVVEWLGPLAGLAIGGLLSLLATLFMALYPAAEELKAENYSSN